MFATHALWLVGKVELSMFVRKTVQHNHSLREATRGTSQSDGALVWLLVYNDVHTFCFIPVRQISCERSCRAFSTTLLSYLRSLFFITQLVDMSSTHEEPASIADEDRIMLADFQFQVLRLLSKVQPMRGASLPDYPYLQGSGRHTERR